MPERKQLRVSGNPRTDLDIDLITQLIILLGRQLAQEASARKGVAAPAPDRESA